MIDATGLQLRPRLLAVALGSCLARVNGGDGKSPLIERSGCLSNNASLTGCIDFVA
jgi:hypothetical protein